MELRRAPPVINNPNRQTPSQQDSPFTLLKQGIYNRTISNVSRTQCRDYGLIRHTCAERGRLAGTEKHATYVYLPLSIKSLPTFVYTRLPIFVYTRLPVFVYTCLSIFVYIYIYLSLSIHAYLSLTLHAYLSLSIRTLTYLCLYMFTYLCL